jgi:hypothetical protein
MGISALRACTRFSNEKQGGDDGHEIGNVFNSDSGSESVGNLERYYALPLWTEYLAAMVRWEAAHDSYCKTPSTGPQSAVKAQLRQALLDAESEKDRLLAMLRETPEHLKAFGW